MHRKRGLVAGRLAENKCVHSSEQICNCAESPLNLTGIRYEASIVWSLWRYQHFIFFFKAVFDGRCSQPMQSRLPPLASNRCFRESEV